jgi:hypothetical protein
MAVNLTVSNTTITGLEASDALAGGSTGIDFGQVANGSYSPIISQTANTGAMDIFISHDATIDPITGVKFYVAQYTGTYGGANSAAADLTKLLAYGAADTGATKNNSDGNSQGLHIDMDWQVSSANQFDYTRETTGQKRIFGKLYAGGLTGEDSAKAFTLHADAISYYNGTAEVDASAPVAGKIGKSTDSVLGNRGHLKSRFYLNSAATDGGFLQSGLIVSYSYTA